MKNVVRILLSIVALLTVLAMCACDEQTPTPTPSPSDECTHSFGSWGASTATCTEDGKERRSCTLCSHYEERTTTKLGHDLTQKAAQASTCTVQGWDAYEACSRCTYTTKELLPLAEHAVGDWYEYGTDKLRRDCADCDYYEEKANVDYVELANTVFEAFGTAPDVWSFLPESFALENRKATTVVTYDNFIRIEQIPSNGMGKQLNVMYGMLSKFDAVSKYLNVAYGAFGTVKSLYTQFLDSNPENNKVFSSEISAFTFTLSLTEEEYSFLATFKEGGATVELFGNTADESYGAKINIARRGEFKFTVANQTLTIGMNARISADNADNSISMLLSFARNNGVVTGTLYEYISVLGFDVVGTSAMIEVGENYTTVIGTKGDFTLGFDGRNCEVYENSTGKLVGTEVRESSSLVSYDTYWFPIYQLSGINTIMKVDEKNGMNPDKVYINGESDVLATKKVLTSRKFDIEFKTMYFYVLNAETDEYEEQSIEIPMLFVQAKYYENFEDDFNDANDYLNGNAKLNVKNADLAAVSRGYTVMLPVYDEIKGAISKEDIIEFCES